ncbi:MAG: hypothetical protein ACT4QF_00435 [Sporichthyaceae bacterium]
MRRRRISRCGDDGATTFPSGPLGPWVAVITLGNALLLVRSDGSTVAARTAPALAFEADPATFCCELGRPCPSTCGCSRGLGLPSRAALHSF